MMELSEITIGIDNDWQLIQLILFAEYQPNAELWTTFWESSPRLACLNQDGTTTYLT